jgi:hypothetical protein
VVARVVLVYADPGIGKSTGERQKTCARSVCKQTNKKRQEAAWRLRSHEHLLAYEQDYREAHRDELRVYDRAYYSKNRDTIRGRQVPYERQYRRDNRRKLAAKALTRYHRDPRTAQSRARAWKMKNRQAMTWYMRQRRQFLKILPGISLEQFQTLRKKAAQL